MRGSPTFCLEDLVGLPASVMPDTTPGRGSACNMVAADVIKSANPGLRGNKQSMGDGLGAGAGGQGKLKGLTRIQEPSCMASN